RYDARRANELRETVDRLIGEKAILESYIQQQQALRRYAERLVDEIEDEESEPSQATVDELREAREALHHLRNICRRILEITRDEYRDSEWEGVRLDSTDQVPHISAYIEPNDKEELEKMRAVMDDKGSRWSTMEVYRRARDLQLSLQDESKDAAGFKAEWQKAEAARDKLNHDWMTQLGSKTAAEAEVKRLKKDLDGKDLDIQDLRNQVKLLADENTSMANDISRMTAEKTASDAEVDQMAKDNARDIGSLREGKDIKIRGLKAEVDQMAKDHARDLKSLRDGKDIKIRGLHAEVKSLADEKTKMANDIGSLREGKDLEIQSLQDQVKSLSDEKTRLTDEISILTAEKIAADSELDLLAKDHVQKESTWEIELRQLQIRLDMEEHAGQTARDDLARGKDSLTAALGAKAISEAGKDALQIEVHRLENETKDVKDKNQRLTAELSDTESTLKEVRTVSANTIQELEREKAALSVEIRLLEGEKAVLTAKVQGLEGEKPVSSEQIRDLEQAKNDLSRTVMTLEDEKAVMSEQIKRLEDEKDQAAKNLEDIRQLQREKSALATKVQNLNINLQKNIDQVKELQANKTHEVGQRSALIADCERQISSMNAKHDTVMQEIKIRDQNYRTDLVGTVSTHLGRLLDRELIEQKIITIFLSLLPNTTTTSISRIWGRINAQYICPPTDQGFDVNFVTVTSSIDWCLSVVDPQKCVNYPDLSFRDALKVLWVRVCCITGPGVASTLHVLEHMLEVWKVMNDQELGLMLRVSKAAIDNIEKELPDDKETRAMTILFSIRCLEVFARLGLQSTEPNRTRVNCMRKRIEDVMQQNAIKNTLFDALLTWLREAFEVRVSSQPPNLIDLLPLSPRFAGVDGRFLFPDSDSTICLVDPGLKLITRFIKVEEVRCRFTIDGVGVSILSARRMPGGRSVIQSRIWAREGGVPFLYIHLGGVLNETDEEVEAAAAAVFAEAARVEALTKFANRERVGPYSKWIGPR
ncbi:hypothetical protein LTR04_004350, partial [Oleoguttula sp. CCFEE 6159]